MGIFKKMFLDRHTTVMERYNLIKKKEKKRKKKKKKGGVAAPQTQWLSTAHPMGCCGAMGTAPLIFCHG